MEEDEEKPACSLTALTSHQRSEEGKKQNCKKLSRKWKNKTAKKLSRKKEEQNCKTQGRSAKWIFKSEFLWETRRGRSKVLHIEIGTISLQNHTCKVKICQNLPIVEHSQTSSKRTQTSQISLASSPFLLPSVAYTVEPRRQRRRWRRKAKEEKKKKKMWKSGRRL